MTTEQSDFITDILVEFVKQAKLEKDKSFLSKEEQMLRRYIFILKRIYVKILIEYFKVFHVDDDNFCTEEKIQLVIDRFNQLCNTDYMVDVSITDIVSTGEHIWDDTLIWDDSDIWED